MQFNVFELTSAAPKLDVAGWRNQEGVWRKTMGWINRTKRERKPVRSLRYINKGPKWGEAAAEEFIKNEPKNPSGYPFYLPKPHADLARRKVQKQSCIQIYLGRCVLARGDPDSCGKAASRYCTKAFPPKPLA